MDKKEILDLVKNELLKEGYSPEEITYSISRANVIISGSVVTANYSNGVVDVWDIVMKPYLVHRNEIT